MTTYGNRWRFWLVLGLLGLVLATAGKWLLNELDAEFYDLYNAPEARTARDATARNRMIARFKIEPSRLTCEGQVYEFEEAWLEAADEPGHVLIWFPRSKRADWSYLCVRPKTMWFQGDFSFAVTPKYKEPFEIRGQEERAFFGHSRGTIYTSRRCRPACQNWTSGCPCTPTGGGRASQSGRPTSRGWIREQQGQLARCTRIGWRTPN